MWGAVASVAGSLISSGMNSGAAGDASNAQQQAAGAAIGLQRNALARSNLNNQPYLDVGNAANARLSTLLGLNTPQYQTLPNGQTVQDAAKAMWQANWEANPNGNADPSTYQAIDPSGYQTALGQYTDQVLRNNPNLAAQQKADPNYGALTRSFTTADLNADPVYQAGTGFGLQQGAQGINNAALANGSYDSGATLKALTRFANNYGTTQAAGAQQRFTQGQQQTYGMLSGQQAVGQNAANAGTAAANNFANNAGNLMTQQGNAQAAGIVGQANAYSGLGQSIGNAYNNYQSNNTLQALLARNSNLGNSTNPTGSNWNSSWGRVNYDH